MLCASLHGRGIWGKWIHTYVKTKTKMPPPPIDSSHITRLILGLHHCLNLTYLFVPVLMLCPPWGDQLFPVYPVLTQSFFKDFVCVCEGGGGGPFLKSIESVTIWVLFYILVFLATRHVRPQLLQEGSNPHALHQKGMS